MSARLKSPYLLARICFLLVLYLGAYFACVQREEYLFDGQFRSLIPEGSLHRVARYRYFDDSHFLATRIFQLAHAVDVLIRRHYWSRPDNQ